MEIILQGKHSGEETAKCIEEIILLFKERYHITQFREIHLSVTLLDEEGEDVELVDSETFQAYRTLEIHQERCELTRRRGLPMLKLVIDNT